MQRTEPDVISVVYSGDTNASKEQIIAKAKVRGCFRTPFLCAPSLSLAVLLFWGTYACLSVSDPRKARFDITLAPQSLHFVFLESRWLVEDRSWPRFTLVGQSLGSMYLAWEALSKFIPDLYIGVLPVVETIPLSLMRGVPLQIRWGMLLPFTSFRGSLAFPLAHMCTILPLVPIC